MTTTGTQLRKLIEAPEITVLPGVHDTLSALIAQSCGAKAIAAGGYAATASLLGRPDSSQLSLTELGDYYARMTDRIEIPILADGDTGFGNVTNVTRTVRVLERSGVGGFFIEDQVFPKRCGHMAGKAIIGVEEMASKLKAALDRMALYHEIGVDILFIEAPTDLRQLRQIPKEIPGPCMVNLIDGGTTPLLSAAECEDIGYAACAMPVAATHTVVKALQAFYCDLLKNGDLSDAIHHGVGFQAYTDLVGLPQQRAAEQAYLDQARALTEQMDK